MEERAASNRPAWSHGAGGYVEYCSKLTDYFDKAVSSADLPYSIHILQVSS